MIDGKVVKMSGKIRIGALISGGGTNLQAIIDSCESEKIDADILFVGSDNPDAKGLARAEKHGIPGFVVNYPEIIRQYRENPETVLLPDDFDLQETISKQHLFPADADPHKLAAFFSTRAAAESALLKVLAEYPFDLLVLAGFMRNLTPYVIDRINRDPALPRIMNIHPALLPAFPGVDGYGDTFRYGCKVGGCTVHFIDYGEDSGPIIGQRTFPIEPDDTLESIKKRGLALEWELYPACIQLYARNRLRVVRKSYTLDNGSTFERAAVDILPPG
jgi:phosphoribosylglycinamide formyltransferase 1